jgi:cytochrome d ubiquinol oxidase subunit II
MPTVWFGLVGILLIGYAVLDGFDLGVGALHLFAKGDKERRILLNSIGPVWDGNEVWLVVGGGALFAAFPEVYATVFSGFYLPFMLLLGGLIFRAVAIEFRSKEKGERWRKNWDIAFSVASIVIALLMGVALGNIVLGIPMDANYEYTGGFFNLLNPYSLIMGVTTLTLFIMHGAIYLALKTEGELQQKVRRWVSNSIKAFFTMFVILTLATFWLAPQMAERFIEIPWLAILPVLLFLALLNVPRELYHGRDVLAFASSACAVAGLLLLFGVGLFPNIVPNLVEGGNALTIENASSSQMSLQVMFTLTLIGMPFVIAYTIAIYWVFRGKVVTDQLHY